MIHTGTGANDLYAMRAISEVEAVQFQCPIGGVLAPVFMKKNEKNRRKKHDSQSSLSRRSSHSSGNSPPPVPYSIDNDSYHKQYNVDININLDSLNNKLKRRKINSDNNGNTLKHRKFGHKESKKYVHDKQTYRSPPLQDDISASISNSESLSCVDSHDEKQLNDQDLHNLDPNHQDIHKDYGYSTPNKMVKVSTYSTTGTGTVITEDIVISSNTNSPSTTTKHKFKENIVMEDISEHQPEVDIIYDNDTSNDLVAANDNINDNVGGIEEEEIITDDKKTQ